MFDDDRVKTRSLRNYLLEVAPESTGELADYKIVTRIEEGPLEVLPLIKLTDSGPELGELTFRPITIHKDIYLKPRPTAEKISGMIFSTPISVNLETGEVAIGEISLSDEADPPDESK